MPLFSSLVLFVAALGYLVFVNTLFPACSNQLGKQDGLGRSHYNKLAVMEESHRSHNFRDYLEAVLQSMKKGEFDQLSRVRKEI